MTPVYSFLWSFAASMVGLLVFAGALWWGAYSNARMWNLVSAAYGPVASGEQIVRRPMETVIVAERGGSGRGQLAYRAYAGVSMVLCSEGLVFSIWPPFSLLCEAIFLPFDEVEIVKTDWAFWSDPSAIRMRRLTNVEIIIGHEAARWIQTAMTDIRYRS